MEFSICWLKGREVEQVSIILQYLYSFSIVCSVYIVVVGQCVSVGKVANKWIEITL